ncbi:hypothetical protein Peur_041656 [Populus x canadensis]
MVFLGASIIDGLGVLSGMLCICVTAMFFLIWIHGLGWFLIYSERVALMLFGFCSSGVVHVDGNGLVFCGVMFLASPKKADVLCLSSYSNFMDCFGL